MFALYILIFALSFVSETQAVELVPIQTTETIVVSQDPSLMDQPLTIEIHGLLPSEVFRLEAQAIDSKGEKWTSWALFQANEEGIINLNSQAPLEGSYSDADGMGLFWSMQPPSIHHGAFKSEKDEIQIQLSLFYHSNLLATQTIHRLKMHPEVQKITVQENGLVGLLFIPPSEEPLPVIIVLGGSDGGICKTHAQVLASHGFATLALGYFGIEGLPQELADIPMEYFEKAFDWIKSRSDLDGSRIGIYGISRGGELSLILGSLFPESIQAITAVVPSSAIYGRFSLRSAPAWTYQGEPVGPAAPFKTVRPPVGMGLDAHHPIALTPSFLQGMQDDPEAFEAAAIQVEKIQCPLLLISGGDDEIWPSSLFADLIQQRLLAYGSTISCLSLTFPKAGHQIGIPYLAAQDTTYFHPVAKLWFSMGGSQKDNDEASRESWEETINFFQRALN